MSILERLHRSLRGAGFAEARTLFFPQPIYPTGWWSATIGIRDGDGGGFREADARAAGFETRYYNAEIHRAAFAEPEFFRRARLAWWGDEAAPA
jgi:spermidine synthase